MTPRCRQGMWAVVVLMAGLTGLVQSGHAAAQDLTKHAESLKFIPASVTAYSALVRNGEQWDAIVKSKAWAKLNSVPVVKMGWKHIDEELKKKAGPLAEVMKWYRLPENQNLVTLLCDMAKDEFFVASGKNVAELTRAIINISQGAQTGVFANLQNRDPKEQMKGMIKAALLAAAENANDIGIPETLVGFRLRQPQAAVAQLKRLEVLGNLLGFINPRLKGRFAKEQIKGSDFLVLRLDGKMIPWDQVPIAEFEDNPGDLDKLVKRLKNMKLVIGIGVRDNFLLLSVAESTALLESLGQGQRLAERPELQRLAKFAERKVTDISYVSKELQGLEKGGGQQMDGISKSILSLLKGAGLKPEQEAKVRNDLKKFNADMQAMLPVPGAVASIGFLTERGGESYSFDWTKNTGLDGSKPLTLLHHLGKSPLLAVVSRQKYDPEHYARLVKWIKIGHGDLEEFLIPKLDEPQQDLYKQIMTQFGPLFGRLNKATGEMLLPALADGQFGLVLDAKLKSKQWVQMMPQADKDLPLLEPALVVGVKDAELLKKGLEEYRDIANKAIEAIGQIFPFIPEFKIPQPDSKDTAEGTLYSYTIPDIPFLALDSRIKPTGGLSKKVGVLTLSHEHATRLLKGSSLKSASPLFADAKKHLTGAAYFNWEGTVHAAIPWIEYIVQLNGGGGDAPASPMSQAKTILQIVTVLKSYARISYFEDDGVAVTRSETVIRDLP